MKIYFLERLFYFNQFIIMKEEIEDTKGVKDNTMTKRKRIEGKKPLYKTYT